MPALWVQGATRLIPAGHPGTMDLRHPTRKVVWHNDGVGVREATAAGTARYLIGRESEYHLILDPWRGVTVQMFPATVGARSLRNDGSIPGWSPNKAGTICIQICVIGPWPFTGSPCKGLPEIMRWLDSWEIPHVFPGGVPPPHGRTRHVTAHSWSRDSGHYGHSQAPQNDHTDPGDIAPAVLWAAAKPAVRPGVVWRTLRRGSKGRAVARLQHGFGLVADGMFGPETEARVRRFQRNHDLTPDGVVGRVTRAALRKAGRI